MTKFRFFFNFTEFTTMKSQPTNVLLSLEAKIAQSSTQIQFSQLDMISIELLELINLGDSRCRVIGAVL